MKRGFVRAVPVLLVLLTLKAEGGGLIGIEDKVLGTFINTRFLSDGSKGTGCAFSKPGADGFLILQLKEPGGVEKIEVCFCEKSKPPRFELFVSEDMAAWQVVKPLRYSKDSVTAAPKQRACRFIKLFFRKPKSEIRISEVLVISKKSADVVSVYEVASEPKADSAVIKWKTGFPCISKLAYNEDGGVPKVILGTEQVTQHSMTVTGLKSGAEYKFRILVPDVNGAEVSSDIKKFLTKGAIQFRISRAEFTEISSAWAELNVKANMEFKYSLRLGKDPGTLEQVQQEMLYKAREYQIFLDGLERETVYYYEMDCDDQLGNRIRVKGSFKTSELNLAYQKPVEGTFDKPYEGNDVYRATEFLSRITDGDEGWYKGMATSGDIKAMDQYLVIDLGSRYNIRKVVVVWRSLAHSRDYEILLSDDRKNWRTAAESIDAGTGERGYSDDGSPVIIKESDTGGKSGRYLKLVFKKGKFFAKNELWKYIQIMEIKAY